MNTLNKFTSPLLLLTVSACVNNIEPGSATSFEGYWNTVILNTPLKQQGIAGWLHNCVDRTVMHLPFEVHNGIATMNHTNRYGNLMKGQAVVSRSGKFKMEIPREIAAKPIPGSGSIGNGRVTWILKGTLQTQKGTLVEGIAEFNNDGCKSKVRYELQ